MMEDSSRSEPSESPAAHVSPAEMTLSFGTFQWLSPGHVHVAVFTRFHELHLSLLWRGMGNEASAEPYAAKVDEDEIRKLRARAAPASPFFLQLGIVASLLGKIVGIVAEDIAPVRDGLIDLIWGSMTPFSFAGRAGVSQAVVVYGKDARHTHANQPLGETAPGSVDVTISNRMVRELGDDSTDGLEEAGENIHHIDARLLVSGQISVQDINTVIRVLFDEFGKAASGPGSVRALVERLAPRLTLVFRNLFLWDKCNQTCQKDGEGYRVVAITFPWNLEQMRTLYPSLAEILDLFHQIELTFSAPGNKNKASMRIEMNYLHFCVFYFVQSNPGINEQRKGIWYNPTTLLPCTIPSPHGSGQFDTFVFDVMDPSTIHIHINLALRVLLWPGPLWIPSCLVSFECLPDRNNAFTFRFRFLEIPPHFSEPFLTIFVPAIRLLRQLLERTFVFDISVAPSSNQGHGSTIGRNAQHLLCLAVQFRAPRFGKFLSNFLKRFVFNRIGSIMVLVRDVVASFGEDMRLLHRRQ
jgi:hypothetical protein